jgi:ribosome-associated protein
VVLLDVRGVASFADYFVIASAMNPRHVRALMDTLEKDIGRPGGRTRRAEGEVESGWVLLDYGDVIVHLFSPEMREYYALEELWSTAQEVVRIQ